jgi:hypothetical protein
MAPVPMFDHEKLDVYQQSEVIQQLEHEEDDEHEDEVLR